MEMNNFLLVFIFILISGLSANTKFLEMNSIEEKEKGKRSSQTDTVKDMISRITNKYVNNFILSQE